MARARDWDVVALARVTSSPDALNALGCTVVIGDALEPSCILDMMGAFGQGAHVVSSLGGGGSAPPQTIAAPPTSLMAWS